jgi:DNA-binding transcriptional LysR family regulator
MSANPINIESLQILDAIERRGSFAKAAEELNKATSALSYGVQKLEEQLGITVFTRKGRRSVLTPAGRLILDEGRLILNATTQLAQKAKELATGWEPKLRIAVESVFNYPDFFTVLATFLAQHPSLEIDICETVLSGGWEALDHDKVDLVIGAPGPVPLQKGYRAMPIGQDNLIPVISALHPQLHLAQNPQTLKEALPQLRRIVTHDTAISEVSRSAGLTLGKQVLYVQTMDQKVQAILAGLGIGHVPKYRIETFLKSGQVFELPLNSGDGKSDVFLAWKISNKGKALHTLTQMLSAQKWGDSKDI